MASLLNISLFRGLEILYTMNSSSINNGSVQLINTAIANIAKILLEASEDRSHNQVNEKKKALKKRKISHPRKHNPKVERSFKQALTQIAFENQGNPNVPSLELTGKSVMVRKS
jgi:hypothetical protein